ncbi:uncharacterized protein LOC126883780 [Diabrotica virgifera virgifera]|uniref:Uncharacterized protein n=1 Tax=Diabrotica virgifera virgifera TaxID=50390 RepID=A0ABM5K5E8_DIAVI|nr:uncharacterized protein LOC126883780 [Diabrotica virgifera virgifera]
MFSNKSRNILCKNAVPRLFPSIEDSPNQHSNVDQDDENSFDPVNEEQREELATLPLGGEDSEVVLQKNQQTQTLESVSTYSPKQQAKKDYKAIAKQEFSIKKNCKNYKILENPIIVKTLHWKIINH